MDNVDFFIKRGDRSPSISATLKDKYGAAVDLTDKAVTFKMRSFNTGEMVVNSAAQILAPQTDGKVEYDWQAADTDAPGYAFAEWEVLLSPGITQTFPTLGWHLIDITTDLDDPTVSDADFISIRRLRQAIAESTRENYSDSLLHAMYLSNDASLEATAAQVWREKAANFASMVDITESGSSRKMSQLYDRAVTQAKYYEEQAGIVVGTSVPRPSIGRIVRQP